MSLSVASNWLWNFGIGYATPYLVNVGPGNAGLEVKVFFVWGSTCACCFIFTYFCVPEVGDFSVTVGYAVADFFSRLRASRSNRSISCTNTLFP